MSNAEWFEEVGRRIRDLGIQELPLDTGVVIEGPGGTDIYIGRPPQATVPVVDTAPVMPPMVQYAREALAAVPKPLLYVGGGVVALSILRAIGGRR